MRRGFVKSNVVSGPQIDAGSYSADEASSVREVVEVVEEFVAVGGGQRVGWSLWMVEKRRVSNRRSNTESVMRQTCGQPGRA
jgi:hypothetical protein